MAMVDSQDTPYSYGGLPGFLPVLGVMIAETQSERAKVKPSR